VRNSPEGWIASLEEIISGPEVSVRYLTWIRNNLKEPLAKSHAPGTLGPLQVLGFFVFLVELGFEFRASHLQSRCCTA
jgi:hypothetical protein